MDRDTRTRLLGADPVDRLLASSEPAARWLTLTRVLRLPADDPAVRGAHEAVLADRGVRALLGRLPDWEVDNDISGHDRPLWAPNLLALLADMGVAAGDDARVERLLDAMMEHQDADGRFQCFGRLRGTGPDWHSLLCDNHAIAEVLLRFGRGNDERLVRALQAMTGDLADLAQGRAWPCRPAWSFRGPGRKQDFCPVVTLQALRASWYLPEERRAAGLLDVARVALRAWRERGTEKPYMFGHGRQFKRVKWPATWYHSLTVLDAVGRYPQLWSPSLPAAAAEAPGVAASEAAASGAADAWPRPDASAVDELPLDDAGRSDAALADVQAIAEIAACLIAYNVDSATGMVTPRSVYEGFGDYSFGQKKAPSPYATARVLASLVPVAGLADAIAAVDVMTLTSSKGGAGIALGP